MKFIRIIPLLIILSCSPDPEKQDSAMETTVSDPIITETQSVNKDSATDLKEIVTAIKDGVEELKENKRKKDSIRDSKEARMWVYQIGDSYDDDKNAAKACNKLKSTESDVFVFKKKRGLYYVIKGTGVSTKEQLDARDELEARVSDRILAIDLSLMCKAVPTRTDPIKIKVDHEKIEIDCKECE
jgi:hypothetical protein